MPRKISWLPDESARIAIAQRDATCDSSPLAQSTKTGVDPWYRTHKPQFRHAGCLIATSIITDVLMMLGRPQRTFSPPAKCVGAPWFGGVSSLSNVAHQLTMELSILARSRISIPLAFLGVALMRSQSVSHRLPGQASTIPSLCSRCSELEPSMQEPLGDLAPVHCMKFAFASCHFSPFTTDRGSLVGPNQIWSSSPGNES